MFVFKIKAKIFKEIIKAINEILNEINIDIYSTHL